MQENQPVESGTTSLADGQKTANQAPEATTNQETQEVQALKSMLSKRTAKLRELESNIETMKAEFGLEGMDDIKTGLELAHNQKTELERYQIQVKQKDAELEKLKSFVRSDKVNNTLLKLGPIAGQEELKLILESQLDFSGEGVKAKNGQELPDYFKSVKTKYPFWFPTNGAAGSGSTSSVSNVRSTRDFTKMSGDELIEYQMSQKSK